MSILEKHLYDDLNIDYITKDTDTSDTGSIQDENDYLSDEEINNNYTFLQKTKKKVNNQYKTQFKIPKKELEEEEYNSE